MYLSPFHTFAKARELETCDDFLAVFASSNIEVFPYQIAAAQFALRSPHLKGVILCDEGSLGKSYEAMLIAVQKWYEGSKIAIIVTTPLYMQWRRLIEDKFTVPVEDLNLMTYEDAVSNADSLFEFDIIIFDEAHYLKNHETKRVETLKTTTCNAFKILLTATPMQNSIMDLYGLIHFIDENVLPSADEFYSRYYRKPESYHELSEQISKFYFRTTRAQVESYTKIPRRIPVVLEYEMSPAERELYELVETYLQKESKEAFPEMDEHRLALQMHRALSSSPFALCGFADKAVGRVRESELVQIAELSATIEPNATAKGQALLDALKTAFAELKKLGANRKAIIFTESLSTLGFLHLLLSEKYKTVVFDGSKSTDYEIIDKFESEAEILIATDVAAEGFNLEFCSLIVNFDIPYNPLEVEQRINRAHRQGQENDVIVLSFLEKSSFGDVRTLEIANKRLLQYQGVIGMSDQIFGNFGADIAEVIRANARHRDEVHREFEERLAQYRAHNEALVDDAESVLFTSFTSEVAKNVAVTPKYIAEKIEQINADLWMIVSHTLANHGYEIDKGNKTATLSENTDPPHLFYYWTGSQNKAYTGLKKYGISQNFKPKSGRITLTSPIGKGAVETIECADEGALIVSDTNADCKLGFYTVSVENTTHTAFVGKTATGKVLTDSACREIMGLPVKSHTETSERKAAAWLRKSTGGAKFHELDSLVDTEMFIQKQLESRSSTQNEEIDRMRLENNRKKSELERNLNAARAELKAAENAVLQDASRHEILKAQRAVNLLKTKVRELDKSLHYDRMKLDQALREQVEEFMGKSKLMAKLCRHFIVEIKTKESGTNE